MDRFIIRKRKSADENDAGKSDTNEPIPSCSNSKSYSHDENEFFGIVDRNTKIVEGTYLAIFSAIAISIFVVVDCVCRFLV